MTKVKTTAWDPAQYLRTEEEVLLYIDAAFEEAGDDANFIAKVLCDVARARGMMRIARE
jgi:probable addiction module antidote protein